MNLADSVLVAVCSVFSILCFRDSNPSLESSDKVVKEVPLFFHRLVNAGSPGLVFPALAYADSLFASCSSPTSRTATRSVAYGIFISASLFRLWAMRVLGRFFTFQLTIRSDHTLIRDTPYNLVRHPSYTGVYLQVCATFLWLRTGPTVSCALSPFQPGLIASVLSAVLATYLSLHLLAANARIEREEAMLSKQFGDDWKAYTRDVPYKLFPYVF